MWDHRFRMIVDYVVSVWKTFVDLTVAEALLIPFLGFRINCRVEVNTIYDCTYQLNTLLIFRL